MSAVDYSIAPNDFATMSAIPHRIWPLIDRLALSLPGQMWEIRVDLDVATITARPGEDENQAA